jgi:hypothetical protein
MSWVAAAIGGSALIGAGASYFAGNKQAEAAQNSLNFQMQTNAQNQANLAPYRGIGDNATRMIGNLYGPNGPQQGWQDFLNSADYKFRFNEGRSALENSAAAKGNLLSGNFARGVTEYGQGMASNEFKNYYDRLFGQASLGANAASGAANNASAMSGQIGQSYGNQGQAQASGMIGAANSLNSGAQNYLFSNALNRSSYGGGNSGDNKWFS